MKRGKERGKEGGRMKRGRERCTFNGFKYTMKGKKNYSSFFIPCTRDEFLTGENLSQQIKCRNFLPPLTHYVWPGGS